MRFTLQPKAHLNFMRHLGFHTRSLKSLEVQPLNRLQELILMPNLRNIRKFPARVKKKNLAAMGLCLIPANSKPKTQTSSHALRVFTARPIYCKRPCEKCSALTYARWARISRLSARVLTSALGAK